MVPKASQRQREVWIAQALYTTVSLRELFLTSSSALHGLGRTPGEAQPGSLQNPNERKNRDCAFLLWPMWRALLSVPQPAEGRGLREHVRGTRHLVDVLGGAIVLGLTGRLRGRSGARGSQLPCKVGGRSPQKKKKGLPLRV